MRILNDIKGLLLLLSTQLLSVVFLFTKDDSVTEKMFPDNNPDTHRYFPFSKVELYPDTFWYFLFEHLILVIFSIYILLEAQKHRIALMVFVSINVIDVFDYLLAYGEVWFYAGSFPISWNILKVVLFSLAIAHEVLLKVEQKFYNQ